MFRSYHVPSIRLKRARGGRPWCAPDYRSDASDAPFGKALERGDVRPSFEDGAFVVRLHGAKLPMDPRSFSLILGPLLPGLVARLGEEHAAVLELRSVLTGLAHLPAGDDTRREKVIERHRVVLSTEDPRFGGRAAVSLRHGIAHLDGLAVLVLEDHALCR